MLLVTMFGICLGLFLAFCAEVKSPEEGRPLEYSWVSITFFIMGGVVIWLCSFYQILLTQYADSAEGFAATVAFLGVAAMIFAGERAKQRFN